MATVHGVSKSWTQLNDSNTSILLGTFLASLLSNRLLLSPTMLQVLDLTLEIVGGRKALTVPTMNKRKDQVRKLIFTVL